ncbi:MFS transporter [Lichenifustis flavocetrariae]|uniref:MFS transporter n=1 Tax=Lichenifustis flavocetrariae TaxID=2949735 RepID=A0AA41YR41_9HYPH|nr:MFS transporter [Lichenifustis flavocetrariae]MCW6506609.1 MFS transporter [Lichenifustis flavocetrariae]
MALHVEPEQRTVSRPCLNEDAKEDGLPVPRRHYATLAILATLVLVVLDGAVANVALPTIAASLHVSPASSVWVVTGYQLALVMALLPCAALGESLGLRRVFVGGVIVFTGASLLCSLSPSLPWLIAARFIQGLGGAAVMALGISLMRFTYPKRLLGAVIGWNATAIALSAAVGPTIGASILVLANWPWLFAINLPVGAIALAAASALPEPPGTGRSLDLTSVALNAITFASLVLSVDLATERPQLAAVLLVVSVSSLVALVRREMLRHAPLIPLDLLRNPSFRLSVVASICCFAGQMASYVALPFYLQHSLGQDALRTGLYMTPWPLMVAVAGPISGRLADRMSNGFLCAAGGVVLALGLALSALWPVHDNLLPLVLFFVLSGLGFGFFQTPNNRNMLLSAPRERSGAAGGLQGTARLLGQTIGGVIMTLLFSQTSADVAPRIGLAVGAVLALAGGLVSALRIAKAPQERRV